MPIAVKKRWLRPKTVLMIVLAPIVLLMLYFVVMTYIVSPIQDSYAKLRFDNLDTQVKKLYKEILATAGDSELWRYKTNCQPNTYSSWIGYTCDIKLSTVSITTDTVNTNSLHQKYYPIVQSASFISQKERPLVDTNTNGGQKTSIKSEYIRYSSPIDESIECSYFINSEMLGDSLEFFSEPTRFKGLVANTDTTKLSFECHIYAPQDWYSDIR